MKFFSPGGKLAPASDKLARRIAHFIAKLQQSFAGAMTRATRHLSTRALKWALLLFLCLGTIFSLYIVFAALYSKQSSLTIHHLSSPKYLDQEDSVSAQPISKSQYERLLRFDHYMDSMHQVNPNWYASFRRRRPGLFDSIKLLESFYNH